MMKELNFGTPHRVLTCLLTLRLRSMPVSVLPDYFSFSHFFLKTSCCFYKLRLSSFNSALNSRQNKSHFCHLNVLVCCCTANQYSKIACFFSKALKNNSCSKVNEAKLTSRNAFIVHLFPLGSEKD